MNKQKAFTLAEVLIVIGIIGIIANLTIPTLVKQTEKQQYVTQLKKFYTTFNQALIQASTDRGCIGSFSCAELFKGVSRLEDGDEFVKYFKISKNCKTTPNAGCLTNAQADTYDGSDTRYSKDNSGYYKFITIDGVSVFLNSVKCSDTPASSTGATGHMKKTCGSVLIDLNGPKKGPNNLGRDMYWFYITDGKGPALYPMGGADDSWTGATDSCNSTNKAGYGCTGKIMEAGWQITYY